MLLEDEYVVVGHRGASNLLQRDTVLLLTEWSPL